LHNPANQVANPASIYLRRRIIMSKTLLKMTKSVANIIDKNAASAAHWLKSGGFAWWTHVTNTSKYKIWVIPQVATMKRNPYKNLEGLGLNEKPWPHKSIIPNFQIFPPMTMLILKRL
jgi:hypothetical protein